MGSDEERDIEEEVFEEASDSQEQLQELGAKFESEVSVESIGGSSFVAAVDKDSTAETFEGAIGTHVEDGISSDLVMVIGDEKVDDLVGEETSDKIDEGGMEMLNQMPERMSLKVWYWVEEVQFRRPGIGCLFSWKVMESNDKEELKVDNSEYQENGDLIGAFVEPQEVKDDRQPGCDGYKTSGC
ncbi:hypothetical protein K2173_012077 [Erythroxylum novogranatense]|uniref:Uncharacterized protein n=1 Tax=Erythroxylum novogranatense TaxID=1862640 RepID=A0AAV8TGJ0_9ROSI|nr:hypothetical protein K2173_012077 [Erythroxylum novogranatense]